jgi:hypothetical protein
MSTSLRLKERSDFVIELVAFLLVLQQPFLHIFNVSLKVIEILLSINQELTPQ